MEECLRGGPFERDTPTLREVVLTVKVAGHAEIGNLNKNKLGDVLPKQMSIHTSRGQGSGQRSNQRVTHADGLMQLLTTHTLQLSRLSRRMYLVASSL